MYHLAAYYDTITNVTNDPVNALQDDIITVQNNNFLPPQDMYVPAAMILGSTALQARLTSPSLRQITPPQLLNINKAALPATDPNYVDYLTNPLLVRGLEELQLQVTGDSTASTAVTGLVWLMDRPWPLSPMGDPITLLGTSTTAAVANTWTTVTYTLNDQLPTGLYEMHASFVCSTNAQAHRWIADNMYWRPGMPSSANPSTRQPLWCQPGVLGVMCQFRNTSLPRLQVLANGTDNAHTIYMRVKRIGN